MINVQEWMPCFLEKLQSVFGERLFFVGLQGSYGRGEANEKSDIDIVVILDELSSDDIRAYDKMLDSIENRALICGFLSGKKELLNWEPSELFQFYFDTIPLIGTLDEIKGLFSEDDIVRAIKIGACGIYHAAVHNILYDKNEDILKGLLKSASFVIQAEYYQRTGTYIKKQKELALVLDGQERALIERYLLVRTGAEIPFDETAEMLFNWIKKILGK